MRQQLHETLVEIVGEALKASGRTEPIPDFTLERPKQEAHGDFACNAAMLLAGLLGESPRTIAQRLVEGLSAHPGVVERAEVAGPGFVNIWLVEERWHDLLRRVLEEGPRYGCSERGGTRSS